MYIVHADAENEKKKKINEKKKIIRKWKKKNKKNRHLLLHVTYEIDIYYMASDEI